MSKCHIHKSHATAQIFVSPEGRVGEGGEIAENELLKLNNMSQ